MNSITDKFSKGLPWLTISSIAGRVFLVLCTFAVIRILSVSDFGKLGLVQNTIGLFLVFSGFGLVQTITKLISEYRQNDDIGKINRLITLTFLFNIAISITFIVLILLFSKDISLSLLACRTDYLIIITSFIFIIINSLFNLIIAVYYGYEFFDNIAKYQFLFNILTGAFQVIGALAYGVVGFFIGNIAGALLSIFFIKFNFTKKVADYRVSFEFRKDEVRTIFMFSFPSFLSSMVLVAAQWFTVFLLSKSHDNFFQNGIFNLANTFKNVILFFPAILNSFSLPILSNTSNNKDHYDSALEHTFVLILLTTLPIFIFVVYGFDFYKVFLGKEYINSDISITVLSLAAVLSAIGGAYGTALISIGKVWHGFLINAIFSVGLILGAFIFIDSLGAYGLSISYAINYFLTLFYALFILYIAKVLKISSLKKVISASLYCIIITMFGVIFKDTRIYLLIPIELATLIFIVKYLDTQKIIIGMVKNRNA